MTPPQSRPGRPSRADSAPRLFRLGRRNHTILELPSRTAVIERSLQRLMERHLVPLLNVRFLASEYPAGTRQEGRTDTLGLDLHGAPVVIEYKRTLSVNLISQGLFYLDWLDEHRGEFGLLVLEHFGASDANTIRWDGLKLVCVAAGFHRYDVRAVRQIKRRIELFRYTRYGDDLLFLAKLAGCST